MKSWLLKFRISTALDEGKPPSESLRRAIAARPDAQRFARRTEALGRALRAPLPPGPDLHDAIMRRVRSGARQKEPRRAPALAWMAASAAVVALAIVSFRPAAPPAAPPSGPSFAEAAIVLEMSEKMPDTMPSMVMAPLNDELARVDRDLQNTKQVLLASIP